MTVLPMDPDADYVDVAWAGDGLVAQVDPQPDPFDCCRLASVDPVTGRVGQTRQIASDPACTRTVEGAPVNHDGGLYWLSMCTLRDEPGLRRIQVLAAPSVLASASVRASVLTRSGLRTWDISGDTIITSRGSVICETLVRYTRASIEPVSIDIAGPAGPLDTGVDPDRVSCDSTAIAMYPTFSRQGRLAFLASTRAVGLSGPSRLSKPMRIYIAPIAHEVVEPVSPLELLSPTGFSWTPDGNGFIVSDRKGTFWVDAANGRATQVLPFRLQSASWSDDGARLVGIRPTSPLGAQGEIVIIETASLEP